MSDLLKEFIDKNRVSFENKEVPAELWERIKVEIPKHEEKIGGIKAANTQKDGRWYMAASVLVFLSTIGYFSLKKDQVNLPKSVNTHEISKVKTTDEIQSIQTENPVSIVFKPTKTNEIKRVSVLKKGREFEKEKKLKEENKAIDDDHLNQEILDALNNQESVSIRIDAIATIQKLPHLDAILKESLLNLSLNDSNTIVRLNALDALVSKLSPSEVHDALTSIFMQQDELLVQMELIGRIAVIDKDQLDLKVKNKLQEMVMDPTTEPFIKNEAYALLLRN